VCLREVGCESSGNRKPNARAIEGELIIHMKKNTTSKTSAQNGDKASVTSDANTQAQSVSATPTSPCMSLQVMEEGKLLLDQPEPTTERNNQPLTPEEEQDLDRCETIIKKNKTSFNETCAAMDEIWTKQLFRRDYSSFKEYCQEKWGFSRTYGYRLVSAHRMIEKVSTMVNTPNLITSGTQAAELAKVPEQQVAAVVKQAKKKAGTNNMTSRHIKEAAAEQLGKATEQAKAVPTQLDTPAVQNTITLTQEFCQVGLPDFKGILEMLDNIASMAAELDDQPTLKVEIAKVRSIVGHYARFESFRKAA